MAKLKVKYYLVSFQFLKVLRITTGITRRVLLHTYLFFYRPANKPNNEQLHWQT